jgi:hypothetical protein
MSSRALPRFWRPVRRYYLWKYRSENPPLVTILAPEKRLDLNETASLIWESLDGTRLIQHVFDAVHDRFPDASTEEIERDTIAALQAWHEEKLVYLNWEVLR